MELIHVHLNVSDVEGSIRFYTEEVGFKETWGFEGGSTVHRYVADKNGVELQLSETGGRTEFDHGDAWNHLVLRVNDVDEAVADIDHYGIKKNPAISLQPGARTAFVLDPGRIHDRTRRTAIGVMAAHGTPPRGTFGLMFRASTLSGLRVTVTAVPVS